MRTFPMLFLRRVFSGVIVSLPATGWATAQSVDGPGPFAVSALIACALATGPFIGLFTSWYHAHKATRNVYAVVGSAILAFIAGALLLKIDLDTREGMAGLFTILFLMPYFIVSMCAIVVYGIVDVVRFEKRR